MIQHADGTVKEYIGDDDYRITINGIIIGPKGRKPLEEINALHQIAKANIPIGIIISRLRISDVYRLVKEDISHQEEPNGINKQGFTISAISDKPAVLQKMRRV